MGRGFAQLEVYSASREAVYEERLDAKLFDCHLP